MSRYFLFRFATVLMNSYSRRAFARLILIFALAVLAVGGVRVFYRNDSQAIAMLPLPLDATDLSRKQVGPLRFLGAWELRSDNSDFGGLSALVALKDGRFIGVSDAGALVGFGMTGDDRIDRPFIAALPRSVWHGDHL
jgi:hypothetical protein